MMIAAPPLITQQRREGSRMKELQSTKQYRVAKMKLDIGQHYRRVLLLRSSAAIGHSIAYIVFPGSAQGWPLLQPDIDHYAAQLFSKWGGLDKAKQCFQI